MVAVAALEGAETIFPLSGELNDCKAARDVRKIMIRSVGVPY